MIFHDASKVFKEKRSSSQSLLVIPIDRVYFFFEFIFFFFRKLKKKNIYINKLSKQMDLILSINYFKKNP